MHIFLKIFFGVNFYIALSQAGLARVPCHRRVLRPPVITTVLRKVTPEAHNLYFKSVSPQLGNNYNLQRTVDPNFAAPDVTPQLLRGGPESGNGQGFGIVWLRLGAERPDLKGIPRLDTKTITYLKPHPGLGIVRPEFSSLGSGLSTEGTGVGTGTPGTGLETGTPGLWSNRPGLGTKNTGLETGRSVLGSNEIGIWTGRSDLATVGSGLGTENIGLGTRGPESGRKETGMWTRGQNTKEIRLWTKGSGLGIDGSAIGSRVSQAGTGGLEFESTKSVRSRLDTSVPRLETENPVLRSLGPGLGINKPGLVRGEPVLRDVQTVPQQSEVKGHKLRTGGASFMVAGNTIEEDYGKSLFCGQLRCPAYELGPPVCACDYTTGKVATFNDLCDMKRHNCRFNTVFKVILNEICPWEFKSSKRTIQKPSIYNSHVKYNN